MPGPTPKPPERRQRRNRPGNDSRGELELAPPVALVTYPKAAPKWLKATKDAWDAFFRSKLATLVDTVTDLPALVRLYSLYDERERAYRAVQDAGRMVVGSKGQTVLNPLLRHMQTLDGEIRQMEDRFGLTPMARLKLGIAFGDAQQSLEAANASLENDADLEPDYDPRVTAIEVAADPRAAGR